jgi:hypothetical protein
MLPYQTIALSALRDDGVISRRCEGSLGDLSCGFFLREALHILKRYGIAAVKIRKTFDIWVARLVNEPCR